MLLLNMRQMNNSLKTCLLYCLWLLYYKISCMDYSSSSRTRDTRTGQFNGGIIKFWNEECKCRRRAIVRIYESKNNPNKLYYKCEQELAISTSFGSQKMEISIGLQLAAEQG